MSLETHSNTIVSHKPIDAIMSQQFTEFATLRFKDPSGAPTPSFTNSLTQLKFFPGCQSLHLGRQIEDPSLWHLLVLWSSASSLEAFSSSPSFPSWLETYNSHIESQPGTLSHLRGHITSTADVFKVVEAPVTEVLTLYGCDEDFMEKNAKPFVEALREAKLPGHKGVVHGSFQQVKKEDDEDLPEGLGVRIFIGWESKESHEAQRGEGKVIDEHIHHVRTNRKKATMYHVEFEKL